MTKFLLDVDDNLWDKFKEHVPRTRLVEDKIVDLTLNDMVVSLISIYIEGKELDKPTQQ